MGFWQFATGGGSGGGSGDVVGPASATDNAVARFDTATGKLLQNSDVTISDLAAGAVTITAGKGTAITLKNTNPDATTGASVAGDALALMAGDAVASTDTAGAAAGGAVTITAGNAARNTSGNANGGPVNLFPGTGIGTGVRGTIPLFVASTSGQALKNVTDVGAGYTGLGIKKGDDSAYDSLWALGFRDSTEGTAVNGQGVALRGNNTGIGWNSGAALGAGPTYTFNATIVSPSAGNFALANATNGMANNIKIATTTVNLAGATTTATGLFPAKCVRLGVTYRVTTIVTSGDGGTSFNVGDGTDADLYGATIAFAAGTTGNLSQATADPTVWAAAAGDVVFTCVGGTFSGGVVRVNAHFIDLTAPTS